MADVKYIYCNGVGMKVSLYDFSLRFNMNDAETNTLIDSVNVFLSPQHAKAFLMVLDKNIKQYEEAFNVEIKLPEGLFDLKEKEDK
jgi:chromosome condensin MukBEF MukE localization factor